MTHEHEHTRTHTHAHGTDPARVGVGLVGSLIIMGAEGQGRGAPLDLVDISRRAWIVGAGRVNAATLLPAYAPAPARRFHTDRSS